MFLSLTREGGLSHEAQVLCHQFVDYREERFATPARSGGYGPPALGRGAPRLLTWASLNVRSIYGREKTLAELMTQYQISVLALQETFQRANDPPKGLPVSTFSKPADNGRRGVMIVVHPTLESAAQNALGLGGGNPNILWITLTIGDAAYFVASVYLPDNSKDKEADEVAEQLINDIGDIPGEAFIIIMGDWNYDPFKAKGKNKDAFKKIMSHPRMALVHRSSPLDYTRPAASSHIDNIFISKTFVPKTSSKMFYLNIPPHKRIPSDHVIVGLNSEGAGRRRRLRTTALQYDMAPLRECVDHAYSHTLDVLAKRWLWWAAEMAAEMGPATDSRRLETDLLYAGLKLTIYSASFQTLPTKRKRQGAISAGALLTKFASGGEARKELWEMVAKRLATGTKNLCDREPGPPLKELEQKLSEQGSRTPVSSCRETKRWVRRATGKLDAEATPAELIETPSFESMVETYYQVIIAEIKILGWKVAGGLDNISAVQVKRAPLSFLRALAVFAARCAYLKCFPRGIRLARAKYIAKPDGKYRGLRLESLLAKLVEKCVLHALFPSFGPDPGLIAPEHFADRKGVSAEMTAGILAILIEAHRGSPLFIVIADAKEAFDNVWRDALWAKAAAAHKCTEEIRSARALYEHMEAQIVEDNFESAIVQLGQGVPQGGPRSGKLFALYNSDLPDALRGAGAGAKIGEVNLTCAIFLDDSMIPTTTVAATRETLATLANYGDRWSQQWAPAKCKVLCLNAPDPPAQWQFKGQWIDSVPSCKYLGVHFDPLGGWSRHFAMKRIAALLARLELRKAGLLGGRNAPADSLEVARAMLWSAIDYGRGVASSQGTKCKGVAKTLDAFQLETLREILGVSKTCRKAGVRGELGEIPDRWRERKRQLLVARQMLGAPSGGLMELIARQANSVSPKLGVFQVVHEFLEATGPPPPRRFPQQRGHQALDTHKGVPGVEGRGGRKLLPVPNVPKRHEPGNQGIPPKILPGEEDSHAPPPRRPRPWRGELPRQGCNPGIVCTVWRGSGDTGTLCAKMPIVSCRPGWQQSSIGPHLGHVPDPGF